MASSEKSTALAVAVSVPEGYQRIGSAQAEAWFSLEPGNVMEGKLLGCFQRTDKRLPTGQSDFFQVELLKPTKARYGKGEKAKVKTAAAGAILNLNCNHKTKELKDLIPDMRHGAEYQIYIHCGEKLELGNGNSMWDITAGSMMTKAPKASEASDADFDGAADDVA
jgi:hypothetical protein